MNSPGLLEALEPGRMRGVDIPLRVGWADPVAGVRDRG